MGVNGQQTFVGRAQELAELKQAVDTLASGRGGLFLLAGEPGIGKTRLAEEVGALAGDRGLRVLWGRCHEADGRPSYWPWAQILQACARATDAETLAAALLPDALPLLELVPALRAHRKGADADPGLDPDTARFRLFQSLSALLSRLAAEQALLLILDDLHWADLPSLRMLEFLAHELVESPILVVGTLREVEVRRAPVVAQVVDRLRRHGRHLALSGLSVEEVARFVEASAGQPVSQALAQRLQSDTEGNPFFLDEIVRQHRGADAWSSAAPAPVSHGVRSAIRQRLGPLSDATRELLSAAAVAGREFDLPLLEAALDTPRAELLDRLAPAVDLEIVNPVADRAGRYRFSHALIRETIYEQVRPSDGVALHRRFGDILERRHQSSLDAYLPELAHHFFAAAAGGAEAKALDYVERAGRQALRMLAYEDAADHFQRALHLSEISTPYSPERDCELLLALAEAKNRAGQSDESSRACHRAADLARRIGSSALLARAAVGLCDIGVAWAEFGRCDETLLRTLEEALEQLEAGEAGLRALVMARIATELFWTRPLAEVDALSRQAVELARQASNERSLAYALMARIHCISDPDSFSQRRALIDEILQLSGGSGKLAINAYLWRFGDELQFGDKNSAQASGERLIQAVEALRQPRDMWLIPAVRSRQALLRGDFAEAEGLAEQVIEHAAGVPNAEQAYLAFLFMIRREQGRHGEMLAGLAAIASQSLVAVWHAPLALLYAENGETENASAEIELLTRNDMSAVRRDLTWLFSVASLAAASNACGSRTHAAQLYEALLPYDGHTVAEGVFCYFGPVAYYLGLLATTDGRYGDALGHLDEALLAARTAGARPFVARILLAEAEAWEANGGAGDSIDRDLRREALELAESMGMNGIAARAQAKPATRSPAALQVNETSRAELIREGDAWVVRYQGRAARVKAVRGFDYLARLLQSPGQEFHVLEMAQRGASPPAPAGDSLGPIIDTRAKAEIRARLADLRDEVEEAEANNDSYRATKARAEIESIGEMIGGAVGIGGRDRAQGSNAERARAAVTKALRTAIDRIERVDPALAEILSRTIRTGTFCSYVPLAQIPIVWEVRSE